jgi:hypothetical protein
MLCYTAGIVENKGKCITAMDREVKYWLTGTSGAVPLQELDAHLRVVNIHIDCITFSNRP